MKTGILTIALFASLLAACRQARPNGSLPSQPAAEQLRFAVMTFMHETCTFCPGGDTTVADWTRLVPPVQGDAVLAVNTYVEGFVAAAAEYPDVELIGLESPVAVWGGSSRSWNTEASFDHFMGIMLEDLRQAMPVDGVYLALHGAMATRNIPRPEAEIARRFRQVVGPDVPIVASFDLHGNEDGEFLEYADMAFMTKRYPHYDAALQGQRSLRALVKIARGLYKPTTASRKPGIITPTVVQWTGASPSMDIMERARRWEAREKDVFVSVAYGFPWADVPDVGATVHVMTNNDQVLAERIADDMSDFIWRVREELFGAVYPQPDTAVANAIRDLAAGAEPVVLADYSDRNGDSTYILRQVIEQGLSNTMLATIRDENVVRELKDMGAGVGDGFDMAVGGFAGAASGRPVRVQGRIQYLGPGLGYREMVAISFGRGNTLLITPALRQVVSPRELAFGPFEPDDYDVFVVKSRVHFRRGFDETGYAESIHVVDVPEPHIGTTRLDALPYENVTLDEHYPYGTPPGRQ